MSTGCFAARVKCKEVFHRSSTGSETVARRLLGGYRYFDYLTDLCSFIDVNRTVSNKSDPTHHQSTPANLDISTCSSEEDEFCRDKECHSVPGAAGEDGTPARASGHLLFPFGVDIRLGDNAEATQQDEVYLFRQSETAANFGYWAKLPVWTLDEAVSLSLGKNPDLVDWDLIEIYRDDAPLANEFWDRRRLVHRYKEIGRLSDTVFPNDFIEWAHQTETDIPSGLKEAVEVRWQQAVDWRQLCYDQKAYYDELIGKWKSACDAIDGERQELAGRIGGLTTAIEERDHSISQLRECWYLLEVARGEAKCNQPDRPLHTKERESLLKITIGLAMSGHGYNPAEERSPAVREMIDDMAEFGISLSADTLRKYLREATAFVPLQRDEEHPRQKPKRCSALSARRST